MAVDLAIKAKAKKIILAHHAPEDKDDDVDKKIASAKDYLKSLGKESAVDVVAISEGGEIWL